ncbi:MAG: AIM24 family protein [Solirubrobacterales bacterium]
MALEQSLAQFAEKETSEAFSLQNSKLLKVELSGATVQARLGSMVAHQGDVKFEHAGSGGMSRFVKKAMTGEGTDLMKVSGTGEVFLAHLAQDVQILRLENEGITANGANVLAFEDGINWDIKRVEGASGMLGGGLYNMSLQGTGYVAIMSDGPPMLIQIAGEQTFADPQAAITWSAGVTTSVKADVNMKTLIGRGSGETMQLSFGGQGWALIQPSEGQVAPSGGSSTGGAAGGIGKFLSG